ncbi:MAG: HlyD family efflux transporter periplasmic adaptor subunit [Bacteriovoracaceae bacterium]
MEKFLKSVLNKESRYLSRSSLLKEGVSPLIPRAIIIGSSCILLGFIVWSIITKIEEVAITTGSIIPIDQISKIQHIDGGEIKKIHVKEGDKVKIGSPLITFDDQKILSLLEQTKLQNNNLKLKLSTLVEQINVKEKLFKSGLHSRMSYLDLKIRVTDLKGQVLENDEVIKRYESQLGRLTLFSKIDGHVHNLSISNSGEVVAAGDTIMEIVPKKRELVAEIRISPDDIGHVYVDQEVTLKFNTYDFAQYGGKRATLKEISPTTLLDIQSRPYYKGTVQFIGNYLDEKKKLPIIPGMTLIGEVKTGQKSLFQYLVKPFIHSTSSAFRER